MQVGDIVRGIKSEATGAAYLATDALGTPGLFGQAFLCRRTDDSAEVVIKTLRAGRSAEDRERFFQEARTLERIAEFEDRAGVQYAVRLLDQSPPDAPETFIVLERATGLNVLDDLVERVVDWQGAPLDELLALDIACHLAQALWVAHQAGICYDDMKLDNLFWSPDRPESPLRIIDWNVTSSVIERGGVAGDWARFGARLYELRTGQRVGINHDGTVIGAGPSGAPWQQLPEGLRDLIEQALRLRHADDETLLRDLRRECQQARMAWPDLLERATIADGAAQTIDVLAPLSRAERQLQALEMDDPNRESGLARCAELRQRAAARRGVASARSLDNAIQALGRGEPKLAIERFQKAYAETGSRDPRPRRWLWLARLAVDQAKRYRALRGDLEAGVEALNHNEPHTAHPHLAAAAAAADLPEASCLLAEAEAHLAAAQGDLQGALERFDQLRGLLDQYPDLKATRDDLYQQQVAQQRRHAAQTREAELWEVATAYADQGHVAEEQGDDQGAAHHYERALDALEQLLAGGCSPELEPTVRASRETLGERLELLARQIQVRQLPGLARSADARQRRLALKLAEQLLPDWPELPQLREQLRQVDACLAILDRNQASERIMVLEQALAAVDALDRVGVKLDGAGADLHIVRKRIVERRSNLKNGQMRARMQEISTALDEAADRLSRARCDDALRLMALIDEHSLDPELREELRQLAERADRLTRRLEQIDEQLAQVARVRAAADLGTALQMAQRLIGDHPEFGRLGEVAASIEQEYWTQIAIAARQVAEEFGRMALKQSTATHLSELDLRMIRLTAQRQSLERPGALAREQREPLRAEADRALAGLERAREQWRRRRDDSVAELDTYVTQAESALAQAYDDTARQILTHIDEAYLPDDAREQGLEPLLIRADRVDGELRRRRANLLARLHDLEERLDDPTAQVWYEELVETCREQPGQLDQETQPVWERVRERAAGLRQDLDRVRRRDEQALNERLNQLAEALRTLEQTTERWGQRSHQRAGELREEAKRDAETAYRAITALEEEHQKAADSLQAYKKTVINAMVGLFLAMLVVTMVAVALT